jgi:hypothetical protein
MLHAVREISKVTRNKLDLRHIHVNIKMDFQEVGWGRGDWMELAQARDR